MQPTLSWASLTLAPTAKWLNENQGVVAVGIFGLTLFLGWASGIFSALRRQPKFRLELIDGPTFLCIFATGESFNGHPVHRIGIALYLSIANLGTAASSIEAVHVGYRWNVHRFTSAWLKFGTRRFWITERTAALEDFQALIGENLKVYPFLFQRNRLTATSTDTFLEPGRSSLGVVYFEQPDSWGGCQPRVHNGTAAIKVRVLDVFGKRHSRKFRVPSVSLTEARKFNPSFGRTIAEMRGQRLPDDKDA